jgi:hypothetical protein
VDADQAVDLYLSAAWRLWRAMPATVGHAAGGTKTAAETMLRVVNEAVEVLIDGHQAARRAMIRQEESVRREFIGEPERVKEIFLGAATDLKRERSFQGAGLIDLMRAIQSV